MPILKADSCAKVRCGGTPKIIILIFMFLFMLYFCLNAITLTIYPQNVPYSTGFAYISSTGAYYRSDGPTGYIQTTYYQTFPNPQYDWYRFHGYAVFQLPTLPQYARITSAQITNVAYSINNASEASSNMHIVYGSQDPSQITNGYTLYNYLDDTGNSFGSLHYWASDLGTPQTVSHSSIKTSLQAKYDSGVSWWSVAYKINTSSTDSRMYIYGRSGGTNAPKLTIQYIIAPPQTISGNISYDVTPLPGVTLNGFPTPPITDTSGNYSTQVTYGWSGVVSPALSGYSFTPSSRSYNNVTSNYSSQNYAASRPVISGNVQLNGVGLSGVSIMGLPATTITDAGGNYTCVVSVGWSGTITPILSGFTFSPNQLVFNNVTSNQTSQSFVANLIFFHISGYFTNSNQGLYGVTLSGFPTPQTTDSSGYYYAEVPYGWSATVTPSLAGYTFTPLYRTYTDVYSDIGDQNYSYLQSMTVYPSARYVISMAGVTNFQLTSSVPWTVEENVQWITVYPMTGAGNCQLTVSYDSNNGSTTRVGVISVIGGGVTLHVSVVQEAVAFNTTIHQSGSFLLVQWNPVDGAIGYRVEQSDNPISGFETAVIVQNAFWITPIQADSRFYRIVAIIN